MSTPARQPAESGMVPAVPPPCRWLTAKEAMAWLRMPCTTFWGRVHAGDIRGRHWGGKQWRFDPEELDRIGREGFIRHLAHNRPKARKEVQP